MALNTTFLIRSTEGAGVSKSDMFDLFGVCLFALLAYAVWPPLALGVFGAAFLLASRAEASAEAEGVQ